MRVIDPGHRYALAHLDGVGEEILTFVKREGPSYPGNIGSHPGTNLQEGLRAYIDRVQYLDAQIHHSNNGAVIWHLRESLRLLEQRAAERHGRDTDALDHRVQIGGFIETLPACPKCGHVLCYESCRTAGPTEPDTKEQR